MGNTKTLLIKISEEAFNKLSKIAEKDNRSVINTTQTILLNEVEELHYEFTNVEPYQAMVKLQAKYIRFLTEELSNLHVMLRNQSWYIPNKESIEQGKVFRDKISKLKFKLKPL